MCSRHLNKLKLNKVFTKEFCQCKTYIRSFSTSKLNLQDASVRRRLFSGIQPTGIPHIGNYLGAISQWVTLQNSGTYDKVIFSVVDLHSITLPQEPSQLRSNIRNMVACLLACGIDPKKSILFQQSKVSEHAELGWVLGCMATLPRLQHLPQWKEKSEKIKEVPLGLFTYPVLQSADILLYKTTDVPVGDDQVKHIELSRHLAKLFNNQYGFLFPLPKPLVGSSQRIKSLRKPESKMSKSEPTALGRIELTDSSDEIREKFRKSVTDSESKITYDPENRPGVANLIDIYAAFKNTTANEVVNEVSNLNKVEFKDAVAELVNEKIAPIRGEYFKITADPAYIDNVLDSGAVRAREIAQPVYQEVKYLLGLS